MKQWSGRPPVQCDICTQQFTTMFFDTVVKGRWGFVCKTCFEQFKCKLGVGQGQRFDKEGDEWVQNATTNKETQ